MWFNLIGEAFVNFAVPLFLFMSGYLTKLKYEDYFVFVKKRFVKVAIPYIVWSIVCCFAINEGMTGPKIINYLLLGKACFPYYYIIIYLQFVLLAPIISKLALSKVYWLGLLISPVFLVIYRYYPLISKDNVDLLLSSIASYSIIPWFLFFYVGLMIGNDLIRHIIKPRWGLIVLSITIIVQIAESFWFYKIGLTNICGTGLKFSAFLTSLTTCIFCVTYFKDNTFALSYGLLKRLLIKIGDFSFGIYLIHILIREGLRYNYKLSPTMEMVMVLLISCLLIFIGQKVLPDKIKTVVGFK